MADLTTWKSGPEAYNSVEVEEATLQTPENSLFREAVRAFAEARRQYRNLLKKLAD